MKTVLGLDLGVASIGWAIVQENEQKQNLIKAGVRIIPIDTETVTNFSKGAATSKNQDRRLKRSSRRNNHRYKLRKHYLNLFLKRNGMYPIPDALFQLNALSLYGLRHKALHEQITLQELARIWYHLNQKRGYIDSRKGQSEDDKDTKYVEKIKDRSKHLYENYKTVGSYFYHQLLKNPLYRIKSGDDKENIFLVDDYKIEFDLIWNKQKEFYPEILNENNFYELRDKIIYYKRKLKSQKHLIGDCRFELKHKCMPVSSPLAEELRLWQDINKIRIKDKYNNETELTRDEKLDLFNFLNEKEKITEKELINRYKPKAYSKDYKVNFEKQLRGYVFKVKLTNLIKTHSFDESIFENFDALANNFTEHPLFKIWHLLYATEESKDIKKKLREVYHFNDELITEILKLTIKNDFAALSSRAARKILPYLRMGMMYDQACQEAGYNHSDSLTKEQNEAREIISIDSLENIKPNQLRNPTVEKILNQLINLLKALSKDGYSFDEIRVELARDLKKNAKERQRITKLNQESDAENKRIYELLKQHIPIPSKKDIEKYKLWKEFDGCSPYEPGNRIELNQLFDKALYEIEHIIPKSRYFDDSSNNKTIARIHVNKEKDNQTAYDYMKGKSPELLHQYEECIKRTLLSKTKRNYLLMSGSEIPDDFITRQLNETRYIAKETQSILKNICKTVTSTSGTVTDYLRHNWGYDNVLMDLNFDRVAQDEIEIKEINGASRKIIKNWTKRNDHRHHAVDAIVIACTKQSYIQQLNTLNTTFDSPQNLKPLTIKTIVPIDYQTVKKHIENILVSFKAGKKVATVKKVGLDKWAKTPFNFGQITLVPRGRLHEDSIYGNNHKQIKIDIKKLEKIDQCIVAWQKESIIKHLEKYSGDLKLALKNLKKDPILYKGNKVLGQVTVFKDEHVKRYDLEYSATNKFDIKAANSIANANVRKIVLARLHEHEDNPEKAFKNLKDNPIYFNKEKGIVIKSVRCYTGGSDYPALHESSNGLTLNNKQSKLITEKIPVDFVKGGNNHHIAIYEDAEGNRIEECITFFDAYERKRKGLPIIQRNHPLGYKFLNSLQQNEMFIFGINKQDVETAIEKKDYTLISKHLYRVRKLTSGNYWFNHQLETQPRESLKDKQLGKAVQVSKSSMNGIKVRVSITNEILIIND